MTTHKRGPLQMLMWPEGQKQARAQLIGSCCACVGTEATSVVMAVVDVSCWYPPPQLI